jgi:hypothetical protein
LHIALACQDLPLHDSLIRHIVVSFSPLSRTTADVGGADQGAHAMLWVILRMVAGVVLVGAAVSIINAAAWVSLKWGQHSLGCGEHLAGVCALAFGLAGALLLKGRAKTGDGQRMQHGTRPSEPQD